MKQNGVIVFKFVCYYPIKPLPWLSFVNPIFWLFWISFWCLCSDEACTSGQLVIASRESQYKILHFHHAGLDKLSEVFQQWKCCRETQLKDQVGFQSKILFSIWLYQEFFRCSFLVVCSCFGSVPICYAHFFLILSGGKWEILHAVFHPEAHPAFGWDPPRGEALSTAGSHHLATSPQPQWPGGGGV